MVEAGLSHSEDGEHPEAQTLVAYSRGTLSRSAAAEVRLHVADCRDCGDQLAALLLLREAAIEGDVGRPGAVIQPFPVPQEVLQRVPAARRWATAAMLAAAVMVVMAGVVTWRALTPAPPAITPGPQVPTVSVSATNVERALVAENVNFLAEILAAGFERAGNGPLDDGTRVARAAQLVNQGDTARARELLEPFASQYDENGTPLLGWLLFVDGDGDAAYQVLETVAAGRDATADPDPDSVANLSYFLLAQLRYAAGMPDGARDALDAIVGKNDNIARAAAEWRARVLAQ
jgi:tetratricopeptide (TPR) repeat protein